MAGDGKAEVEIRALHDNGDGVTDSPDGRAELRIPGVFPGERVRAKITHIGKRTSHGVATNVLTPRDGRRPAPCGMHASQPSGRCTGCAFMMLTPAAQRSVKREWLKDSFSLDVPDVNGSAASGYRWSSKRVAFGGPGTIRLGSFVRGTHNVAHMQDCWVEHPAIVRAATLVEKAARSSQVAAYDDSRGSGDLRHVWFKTDGEGVLVTLIMAHNDPAPADDIVQAIRNRDDDKLIVGAAKSVNAGTGNVIRGTASEPLFGSQTLAIEIAGVHTHAGPLGFLQPNPEMAGRCYRDLVDGASGKLAVDLYAGAGVTTELLRACCDTVVAVESYPESAAALGVEPMKVAAFLEGYKGETPDVVVANPPRRGLGAAVTLALRKIGAASLRIMSCGPKGLAQDLSALTAAATENEHSYTLTKLRAYDTLPQTPHVELVAHLELRGDSANAQTHSTPAD